jgi:hypothetical protein
MHSSRGTLTTMCGSRTGGWSLSGVMSDWQRCVDWFLAKYCRCRLRLDWCWCRWWTSAKGRCRWGLLVWRRQVGFVQGTRWPAESSAGRMVAWTARWIHGRFLGWASKPRSSRDYVGAESWVEIGGGYTEFAGFPVVHQKNHWVPLLIHKSKTEHYVKTSNRSRSICNVPLTPVTSTHICNGCCLAPVTYKRARTTPGLASTTPVTNVLLLAGFLNARYMNSL